MIELSYRWLLAAAAAYLALLPTNAATFIRSVLFGVAAALALSLLAARSRGRGERIPSPGSPLLIALAVWCLWNVASIAWSVHPMFSATELRREMVWGLLIAVSYYVAARDAQAWQTLVAAALASFALFAALAIGLATSIGGWDAGHWHAGVGAFSTYLVMVAPFLMTLVAPPPAGFGDRASSMLLAIILLILMLATARLSDNRMVWVALAAVFATAATLSAIRWRAAIGRAPMRWLAAPLALLVIIGALFAETALDKARAHFPAQTTLTQTFTDDPRIQLWDRTIELISGRPWLGYGFGKSILQHELKEELRDPMMTHAHNLFVSQWLQTGYIGFAAFAALMGTLLWRYIRFFRARDDATAVIGVIGIALLAGFVVKNLTDDFLVRSNSKEFWALNAVLLGFGARRERASTEAATVDPSA